MAIAEEQNRENSLRNQSNSNNQNGSKVSVDGSGSRPKKSIVKRSTSSGTTKSGKSKNNHPESESLNSMCRSNSRKSTNTNNTNSQVAFSSINSSPKRSSKYLKSSQELINQDNVSRHSVVNFSSSITNISFKNDSLAVEYVSTTTSPFLNKKKTHKNNKSNQPSSSSTSICRQPKKNSNNDLIINLPVITHTCATPITSPTNSPSRNSPITENNLNPKSCNLLSNGVLRKLSLDSANDRIKKSKSLPRLFSKSAAKIYDKKQSFTLLVSNNHTYPGKETNNNFKVSSIPKILISDTSKSDFKIQDTESIASFTSDLTQIICPTLAVEENIDIDKLNDSSSHIENEKKSNMQNNSIYAFKNRFSRSLRLHNESNKLSLPSNSFYNRRSKSEKIERKSKRYDDFFVNKTLNFNDNNERLDETENKLKSINKHESLDSKMQTIKCLDNNTNNPSNIKSQPEKKKINKKQKNKSGSNKTKNNVSYRSQSNKRSTSNKRQTTQRKSNRVQEIKNKTNNSPILDPDEEEMIVCDFIFSIIIKRI